jgi:hypothetical protein
MLPFTTALGLIGLAFLLKIEIENFNNSSLNHSIFAFAEKVVFKITQTNSER